MRQAVGPCVWATRFCRIAVSVVYPDIAPFTHSLFYSYHQSAVMAAEKKEKLEGE